MLNTCTNFSKYVLKHRILGLNYGPLRDLQFPQHAALASCINWAQHFTHQVIGDLLLSNQGMLDIGNTQPPTPAPVTEGQSALAKALEHSHPLHCWSDVKHGHSKAALKALTFLSTDPERWKSHLCNHNLILFQNFIFLIYMPICLVSKLSVWFPMSQLLQSAATGRRA